MSALFRTDPFSLSLTVTRKSDGIAAAITISTVNYVMLGFQFPVDGFYMHSFEVWLATTVVFFGSGNVGFTLLEYRLGEKSLVSRCCAYKKECVLI